MNRRYINKDWSTLKKLIAINAAGGGAPLVEYTATGNPATFETNVIAPIELLIPFAPVQSGSGDPSPTNIRPISGLTGANVTVSPTSSPDAPDKEVYPITFPQSVGTVYGGELTINRDRTGELVVERCQYSLTGNEAFDVVTVNGQRRYQSGNVVSVLGLPAASTEVEDITSQISSHMVALNSNSGTFGHFRVVSVMIFNDSESAFADATAFKAYLLEQYSAGTPVQVVYKLATPVTYQLTDLDVIETLKGVNNVWSDTNGINTIKYMKKG